jgi:hypothetical protein
MLAETSLHFTNPYSLLPTHAIHRRAAGLTKFRRVGVKKVKEVKVVREFFVSSPVRAAIPIRTTTLAIPPHA